MTAQTLNGASPAVMANIGASPFAQCGHRVSLAQLTVDPVATLPFVTAAAAAGFRSVGLRLAAAPGPAVAHAPLTRRHVIALKRRLADTGVSVDLATGLWMLPDTQPAGFEAVLDLAADLGVECMLVVCNDQNRERARDRFSATCQLAAQRGLTIGLEFMAYTSLKSIAQAEAFLKVAKQPNAALIIDALHLARSGGTPVDVASIDPGMIALVQLCDAPLQAPAADALRKEARGNRLYPGEGELWLDELMDALRSDIWIDVEAPCAGDATAEQKASDAAAATARFLAMRRGNAT